MKPKKRSKSSKGTRPRTNPVGKARRNMKTVRHPGALVSKSPVTSHPSTSNGCEEVEIGDIGGFGDPEELEAHEKRCGEKITEFCQACDRKLCSSHYELLHRDHDTTGEHSVVRSIATSNQ